MRRWLITGISSGIGAALAKAALARGDHVVGTARTEEARAAFEAGGAGRATGIVADMSDPAQVAALADRALAAGPVDIVVNNAGQSLFGAAEEVDLDDARNLFEVNFFGPWALTQALLPHFRSRGSGTIVQLSSGCGLNGTPGLSAYCASKFALEGLTETLALEVAAFGIRAMLVEPGAIATRFISHGTQEAHVRIPDYDFLSGQGKAVLDGYYATAASPPEFVADAILTALDGETLPLRLPVGDDMRGALAHKASAFAALADG
ncbi:short-chain dehydrogenase/reductase SDR [Sphingobium chlorophenolicum L-1]|uniref:Short-chain dehydrogenase/reductase SDR n=1 Tax=Sphingobium chlorophenolicum L-1 TaxID=690566 RepID=F6F0U2_SPHCR|nr:SDR family oxidoreductase [Sphingobium chlorophenolicum]AEG51158.1 short-chain dehydrogenase/reductase SDR [Sphingobium chlorophenolicum L-1]